MKEEKKRSGGRAGGLSFVWLADRQRQRGRGVDMKQVAVNAGKQSKKRITRAMERKSRMREAKVGAEWTGS